MSEKKRKMIDVDPAVVEMFARVLQKLKPPPKLTISEWADWFRQMSPEASAGTGRWHTDNAPYQREIMDAIGNPHVRMVVFKSSSQVGKTEVLLNVLGYYIDYNPAPILVLQPTVEMGQTFSKDRLAPMIRDTAVLRKKMDAKSRFSGNTIMQKTFPGGHVTIVGANSPAGLASRPIKIVLADEVDRYPVSAGTEGDPLNLAQTRQTTFWDKKTVLVSTPTIKGSSRIESRGWKARWKSGLYPARNAVSTNRWSGQMWFLTENAGRKAVYSIGANPAAASLVNTGGRHREERDGTPPCTRSGKSGDFTSTSWLHLSAHGPAS